MSDRRVARTVLRHCRGAGALANGCSAISKGPVLGMTQQSLQQS